MGASNVAGKSAALCFVAATAALYLGLQIGAQAVREEHRDAVFHEQITKHGCKQIATYVNGRRLTEDVCKLPDGTIIRRR